MGKVGTAGKDQEEGEGVTLWGTRAGLWAPCGQGKGTVKGRSRRSVCSRAEGLGQLQGTGGTEAVLRWLPTSFLSPGPFSVQQEEQDQGFHFPKHLSTACFFFLIKFTLSRQSY